MTDNEKERVCLRAQVRSRMRGTPRWRRKERKEKAFKESFKMKFMQRTEEAKLRQKLEEEEKREIDETHWVLDNEESAKDVNVWEYEPSFVVCENLLPTGRMSFKKFNPTIEKLFKEIVTQKELAECEDREREECVTDEQMVERFNSLIDTVDKKFSAKRKRQNVAHEENTFYTEQARRSKKQKMKFKKPKED
ncbi:M-phase phosphoprotein 6-like [Xenia sp. Carnegie-2017]|uniref:M-phase phosphoprotein 6-like n=1 Tax=Xenia sp. Carnegie-2017 TaxID=2897299 RepID=UPI001F0352F4|nr:M-phase phosphoprotein 6-like [Xenia sp. Carnegie-2017]